MNNIVIVLLERATDRVSNMKSQVEKLGLKNVHYYPAVDGLNFTNETFVPKLSLSGGWRYNDPFKPGEIGCTLSHIGAISMAKSLDWDHVIILEDDITIAEDFKNRIEKLMKIVPQNWEHIYLSGTPHHSYPINHTFLQVVPSVRTDTTHSYMLHKRAYNKVLKKLLSMETTTDDLYNHLMFQEKNLISYTFYPFVTHSNSSFSYIWNKAAGHNIKNESKNYFINKL